MRIEEQKVGDVVVMHISGEITIAKGGDVVLKDKVRSLLQQGMKKLIIDLGEVSYMDSAGLGQLVQAYATTTNAGGSLKLARLNKRIKDLLTITKLVTVFDSYDDQASAVASFTA